MAPTEYKKKYGREAPTTRERELAAIIRVRADQARGKPTPGWIVKLANNQVALISASKRGISRSKRQS